MNAVKPNGIQEIRTKIVSTKNDVDLEVVIQSLCNKITRGVEMKTRPHDLQSWDCYGYSFACHVARYVVIFKLKTSQYKWNAHACTEHGEFLGVLNDAV